MNEAGAQGEVFTVSPTMAQRFWRRLGFGFRFNKALFDWRHADLPGLIQGGVTSHIRLTISLGDRLRLLLSGKAEVHVYVKTDVLVKHAATQAESAVLQPFDRSWPR